MGIDVDRFVIDFGVTVLIGLEFPIKRWIGFVDFEVAIAVEAQKELEGAGTEQKNAQR